jgi:hypothetical protein
MAVEVVVADVPGSTDVSTALAVEATTSRVIVATRETGHPVEAVVAGGGHVAMMARTRERTKLTTLTREKLRPMPQHQR